MKKKYQQPLIKVLSVENETLLNGGSIVDRNGNQKDTLGSDTSSGGSADGDGGAMLSLITPGHLGIKVYCKQNARLKNSLNPAFYFFCC